jgi:hypothetical protein
MLRKILYWVITSPFVVALVAALILLAIALFGLYFFMQLLGAPEAEWSA